MFLKVFEHDSASILAAGSSGAILVQEVNIKENSPMYAAFIMAETLIVSIKLMTMSIAVGVFLIEK